MGSDGVSNSEKLNGADGISDIEGKVTRIGASECGQRASFNGANAMSDPPTPTRYGVAGRIVK